MSLKKILILGSEGLLGSSLVPYLNGFDYQLICHSRKGDTPAKGDLTDKEVVWDMLNTHRPDVIINLAAATNVDECEKKPNYAYLLNVKILENIVTWVKSESYPSYLIHVSTDQVYDGEGFHSEEEVSLTNYYSFSKYMGELVAEKIPSTILRTNFFGKSKNQNRKSFSDWILESVDTDKEITVFQDIYFSPLSLKTLTSMIRVVLTNPKIGIYNLGAITGMSKAEFAHKLVDAFSKQKTNIKSGSISDLNLKAYRPRNMTMNVSKFEETFQLKLPSLEDEILSLLDGEG